MLYRSDAATTRWQKPLLSERQLSRSPEDQGRLTGPTLFKPTGPITAEQKIKEATGGGSLTPARFRGLPKLSAVAPRAARARRERPAEISPARQAAADATRARLQRKRGDARCDALGVELVIDGTRCVQDAEGVWRTPDGKPCTPSKAER